VADISDITAYLKGQALAAIYPNGAAQPVAGSILGLPCRLYEGWPIPDQLDHDMAGTMLDQSVDPPVTKPNSFGLPVVNVSIFPMQGTGASVPNILDETYTITPAAVDITLQVNGQVITCANQPAAGEYITVVLDDAVVSSQTGASTAAILAALASDLQSKGYAAVASATTLTVPFIFSMVVRQGGVGLQGKVTWRQCHDVAVTVWAPTQALRTQAAKAIDNVIKQNIKITLPDTSQAKITYSRTQVLDEQQIQTIYRRDLIYRSEYGTVMTFPAHLITTTNVSIAPAGTSPVNAIV
jgi:hypothetical protein